MLFFKRIYKTLIGFVTCAVVVVVLMLLLWPTFDSPDFLALIELNTDYSDNYGAGGHFWVILMMLLNPSIFLNITNPVIGISQPLEDMVGIGAFILILGIWFIGSFAGGLASRGGLRSGLWSAVISYFFLSFLFATLSGSLGAVSSGVSFGSLLVFIINLFAPMVLGSFFIIPVLGIAGGIVGGILGKMVFTKSKKKDNEIEKTTDKEESED
ncbi:MAG: hypothetical protein ACTSQF_02590 [Candidatus Heimdallarchaeaceae archaeon]